MSSQKRNYSPKPAQPVGAWQCLDCLRVERRVTQRGYRKDKQITLRALERRCFHVGCPCNPIYRADGDVGTMGAMP